MLRLLKYLPAVIAFLRTPKGKAAIAKVQSARQRATLRLAKKGNGSRK
ncbi:MAG: hypothetical protein JWQ43_1760 [Glaciihabitans sp.]|nr:hypothetical protein [Glaciihabitans sp.]